MGKVSIELLQSDIEVHLTRIEKLLPPEYRLTLVARHTENENAHIVLTLDDPAKAVNAINILYGNSEEKQVSAQQPQ